MSQPFSVVILIEKNMEKHRMGGLLSQNLPQFQVVPSKSLGSLSLPPTGGVFWCFKKSPAIAVKV